MRRTGSGASREQEHSQYLATRPDQRANLIGSRAPSSLSARRDSPIPRGAVSNIMDRPTTYSPRSSIALRQQQSSRVQTPSQMDIQQTQRASINSSPPSSPSSNSGSSSSPSPAAPPRVSRRPPQFAPHRDKRNLLDEDDDDEDDDEPAFMLPASTNDPSATLRDDPRNAQRKVNRGKGEVSQTSDSSASSASRVMSGGVAGQRRGPGPGPGPGPLSPKRTAELSGRKESSDGTPSMGSSFSDLDGTYLILHHITPYHYPLYFQERG